MLLRNLLVRMGLRRAPLPVRSYLTASGFVGALPAAAYVGWKYRSELGRFVRGLDLGKVSRRLGIGRNRARVEPSAAPAE